MASLEQLRERQKRLDATRRAVNAEIRKVEVRERKQMYLNVGSEMEKFYSSDPTCRNYKMIAAICRRHFGPLLSENESTVSEMIKSTGETGVSSESLPTGTLDG